MIQLKRQHRKEDYGEIRNQLSQEQTNVVFMMICSVLVLVAVGLIYITLCNLWL
jgi:uncharacterized membrane protein YiaA